MNTHIDRPLFHESWWLDATAGEGCWGRLASSDFHGLQGEFCYAIRKQMGFRFLVQPPLTLFLGLRVAGAAADLQKHALTSHKGICQELIQQLPNFDHLCLNFPPTITNWLPFHWAGFRQTTRYTYVIDDLTDLDKVWASFHSTARREIRKAENRYGIQIRTDGNIDELIRLNHLTFSRQKMKPPYTGEYIKALDAACAARGASRMFIAEDDAGHHHASVYTVWDKSKAYYLMGGADPGLRTSGAASLCMWHAIRHAATVVRQFDFGGSMLEPVERFFRSFGATQAHYSQIQKTPSRLLRSYFLAKELVQTG